MDREQRGVCNKVKGQTMTQKHDIDEAILEPYKYLSSVPGKDVRSKLIDCFQQWLQIDAAKLEIIKELHQ